MLKIILAVIVVIALAVGGKIYYKAQKTKEIAARVAQQEAEKKAADEAIEREKQAAEAKLKQAEMAEQEVALSSAKKEIERSIKDPAAVQYRNLKLAKHSNFGYTVCGELNAKNGFGAYVGFKRFIYQDVGSLRYEPDLEFYGRYNPDYKIAIAKFVHSMFILCTPPEELEAICNASPERCSDPFTK